MKDIKYRLEILSKIYRTAYQLGKATKITRYTTSRILSGKSKGSKTTHQRINKLYSFLSRRYYFQPLIKVVHRGEPTGEWVTGRIVLLENLEDEANRMIEVLQQSDGDGEWGDTRRFKQ